MNKQEIETALAEAGFTMEATFTPDPGGKMLGWTCVIQRTGGRAMTTPYKQGVGHLKGYDAQAARSMDGSKAVDAAITQGVWDGKWGRPWSGIRGTPLPKPSIADVLYCLVSDASVLDHPTFESWARDYGYDTDGRSAEKTYRLCLESALRLRAWVGEDGLTKLQVMFQDY